MTKYSGNFGKLALRYDVLRPQYPKNIISLIYNSIPNKKPIILDLGCGTAISTRQLAKGKGTIIGYDIDNKMLKVAIERPLANISYKKGSAEKLSFSDNSLDAVTAFIAFHWFGCGTETKFNPQQQSHKPFGQ